MIFIPCFYSSRQPEGCDGVSLQTVNYQKIIPHGLFINPKATTASNSGKVLSVQLAKNTAYASRKEHPPPLKDSTVEDSTHPNQYDTATDQEMSPAPPSSDDLTYSCLKHLSASCDTNSGEWESQYSMLSHVNMEPDPISKKPALSSEACGQKSKPSALDD